MELDIVEREGVWIVRVREARLTYPVLSAFFDRMRDLVDGGASRLLLDLGTVTYMDSAAIGCIMDIHRLLRERKGALRICKLAARVATMLSMTGVDRVVGVHETDEDALSAFGQDASWPDANSSANGA
ncbi:MAG: STAS domain-containing protein [Vicinamibacteria bacterium]|nr:STAS domain-containing protein [Vicinamibacteria bacterium]